MNKQPFYHRIDGLLFTSTTGFDKGDFLNILKKIFSLKEYKFLGVIINSIEIEQYAEPEPGDPSDLI